MDYRLPYRRTLHAPLNGAAYSNGVTDLKLPGSGSRITSPSSTPRPMTPINHQEALDDGGWIVQKFGGTSVGKFPKDIARDVVR